MQIPGYYEFYNRTKISSGRGALDNIPFELRSMDSYRPFVIADRAARRGVAGLVNSFHGSDMTIGALFEEMEGPVYPYIAEELLSIYRKGDCDSLIAVGGYAAASAAMALNIILSSGSERIPSSENFKLNAEMRPFVYVPSAGVCGRETAGEALIGHSVYRDELLVPDLAVLDRRMLHGVKGVSLVPAAMLALARSTDVYLDGDTDPLIASYASASISLVYGNLYKAMKRYSGGKERLALLNGIAVSGLLSSPSRNGIVTTAALELEKFTGHPAGLLAGIILPFAADYIFRKGYGFSGELLLPFAGIDNYCSVDEKDRGGKMIELLYLMLDNLEGVVPCSLRKLHIPEYIIRSAVEKTAAVNGIKLNGKEILEILMHAHEGTSFNEGGRV